MGVNADIRAIAASERRELRVKANLVTEYEGVFKKAAER